ncbi:MAG TPA: hypothetical protein VE243_01750 [Candidatus Acidoferrum sp.]|nr:hypothetical protein [Candidatus Acidoferrum sp.]
MSWPIKLRAMSFAVTMGVTLTESIMGSIPIGLALWYFHVASFDKILEFLALLEATISLSISIYSHVLPAKYPRSIQKGGAA